MMFKVYFKKIVTLLMVVVFLLTAFGTSANLALAEQTNNQTISESVNVVQELFFSDSQEFYKELTRALQSGESVNIITDYSKYSDFPKQLKEIVKPKTIDTSKLKELGEEFGDLSCPSGVECAPAELDYSKLVLIVYALAGAAGGAAIGTFVGGIGAAPGALIGAGFGLVAGTIGIVLADHSYEVVFEFVDGKIIIIIRPLNKNVA